MDDLTKTRRTVQNSVTRTRTAVNKHKDTPLTAFEISVHFDNMVQASKDAQQLEIQISRLATPEEQEVHDKVFNELACKIDTLKAELLGVQNAVSVSIAASKQTSAQVKLPKLELPKFSGNLHDWQSFHDLFVASVHNSTTLTGAQKLQYLKASLHGDAANLVQSFQATNENYNEAWDVLQKRFQNTRELINCELKRLFSQPVMQSESSSALRKLVDTTIECFRTLTVHKQPTDQWDTLLMYIVTEKLDATSRREWELNLKNDDVPTFNELIDFLEQRVRALSAAGVVAGSVNEKTKSSSNPSGGDRKQTSTHHGTANAACGDCKGDHDINKCPEFLKRSVDERVDVLKKNSLCFNCLGRGHSSKKCERGSCRKCDRRHHTLIHREKVQELDTTEGEPTVNHCTNVVRVLPRVLLATAICKVQDVDGEQQFCRVFLDQGSEANFLSENCMQRLGLKRRKINLSISGVANSKVGPSRGIVQLNFSSRVNNYLINVQAVILNKVTGLLPRTTCDPSLWNHIVGLELADPQFFKPEQVDILLVAGHVATVIKSGRRVGSNGGAIAQETMFGWILSGNINNSSNDNVVVHHTQCDLDKTLTKFWEIEELRSDEPHFTPEEKMCEEHFLKTHHRNSEGRFIVNLPFRNHVTPLGDSRNIAIKRFKQVERRLSNSPQARDQYVGFMREYVELVPPSEIERPCDTVYYLRHHFVQKLSSSTTKFRVVFDGSCKSSSEVSLNDRLMVGPKLQDDIIPLLLRFRTFAVPMTADIQKMYRQFLVDREQVDFQRIIWRESPSEVLRDYRLLTVTYETASASYLATKCVQQLAKDEAHRFPFAAAVHLNDVYVDDLISGEHEQTMALELKTQLLELTNCAKLELMKWVSSDPVVLESLPIERREVNLPLQIGTDESIKALGIQWHPATDHFTFTVNIPQQSNRMTKRLLLSEIAKLFDPLGWLSPVTINAKLMMQRAWKEKSGWDDPLCEQLQRDWKMYCRKLSFLELIKIPRRITCPSTDNYELHGFSDASELAYSAVVYVRSVTTDFYINVTLITAKTKVAPINQLSILRLELCGALLLSRLLAVVSKSIKIKIKSIHQWTDSTIVLDWLASDACR